MIAAFLVTSKSLHNPWTIKKAYKMKTIRKSIKRITKESAYKAMEKHISKMLAKGWKIEQEFSGESFLHYECITYFSK